MVKAEKRTLLLNAHRGQNACEWQEMRLNDVCTKIGSGATPRGGKAVYLDDGPYALIRSQNVYNSGFQHDGLAYISEEHAAGLQNVEVLEGDVLLNITGHSVARICQVDPRILPARVNQHVAIIRTDSTRLDSGLLRYFLASPNTQALLLSLAGSGGTRNALTKEMIESLSVPAPPLPEQRAIAHILGTLDDKIELNRRMNQTLEEMARAIFKDWFIDFGPTHAKMDGREPYLPADVWDLFPDSLVDSELGEIPSSWKMKSLGDVIEIHDAARIPLNSRQRTERQGQYPYYGASGVMDHVDDYLFDGIYVLTGEDGTVVDGQGHPVVQYVWGQFWVNNHAHVLKGKGQINEEHLYLFLEQTNIQAFVTGAVQPKLNQRNLKSIPFVMPNESTCNAFTQVVEPIFAKVRANADEAALIAAQRDALLPKLVAGEIRLEDSDTLTTSDAI